MVIREATAHDAEAMSRVLVASIVDLCARDHGCDANNIARWTANKSPDEVRAWFENRDIHVYVAEREGSVLGVGAFDDNGEIILNYVAPDARFSGVSKAMLAHLEKTMCERGNREARLTSTVTAHRFYLANGWKDFDEPKERFGITVRSMKKSLAKAD